MFTLYSDQWGRNCEGIHRRELLRVGSLGMAGLTLSNWSRAKAQSATDFVRDKSHCYPESSGWTHTDRDFRSQNDRPK